MPDALAVPLWVATTIVTFRAAEQLYRRTRVPLLNPVLVTIVALVLVLVATGTRYDDYARGGRLLGMLLAPAVVALGVTLHQEMPVLRANGRVIAAALVAGSGAGCLAAVGVAALLGAPPEIVRSLAPRAVTTPIAMQVAARVGGIPALSAIVAILSGVAGAALGVPLLRALGVRGRMATGLALGAAAHGVGTARAAEQGTREAAAAGLAIGIMGVLTAIWAPLLLALVLR